MIEHNGDLYPCDHFVYPKYRLGNISEKSIREMMSSAEQIRFGIDKRNVSKQILHTYSPTPFSSFVGARMTLTSFKLWLQVFSLLAVDALVLSPCKVVPNKSSHAVMEHKVAATVIKAASLFTIFFIKLPFLKKCIFIIF